MEKRKLEELGVDISAMDEYWAEQYEDDYLSKDKGAGGEKGFSLAPVLSS